MQQTNCRYKKPIQRSPYNNLWQYLWDTPTFSQRILSTTVKSQQSQIVNSQESPIVNSQESPIVNSQESSV